ncbi:MAG TPA: FtsX-like permease family protein [Vicinamibacterales bacterium]|nr:FtsX-like permease family protein [Vicinamibacterales bacterium]
MRRLPLVFTVTLATLACVGSVTAANLAAQTEQLPTILITRQVATAEKLQVGDAVSLSSKPDGSAARRFRIAGIYEPVADPMRLAARRHEARLHLPDLLSLTADPTDPLSTESATAINVALTNPRDADAFARDVSARIPIPQLTARATQGGEESATVFVVLDRFHFAIAIVTVVASTVFLLALMLMLVDERRGTVGILRLIGLRKSRILLQVFAEGLLIAVAGAAFGILFAAALEGAVNAFFQWRYDTALVFVRITPQIALRCVLLAVPLGVLASVISSWSLLRSNVLELARR